MAANGRRMTGLDPETAEEALLKAAGTLEVALNDHAVCLAQATRDAAPDLRGVEVGLHAIAGAINNLAEAVRERHRLSPG